MKIRNDILCIDQTKVPSRNRTRQAKNGGLLKFTSETTKLAFRQSEITEIQVNYFKLERFKLNTSISSQFELKSSIMATIQMSLLTSNPVGYFQILFSSSDKFIIVNIVFSQDPFKSHHLQSVITKIKWKESRLRFGNVTFNIS